VRRLVPLLAAALLVGCGGDAGGGGKATIWITRDRGETVLLVKEVPAGLTAMQALDRVADLETGYGGRYVQEIDGLGGSLTQRRDWFWFLNGYEGDRSAAEYTLRAGDVEWWDYRRWRSPGETRVVVGAFPEPFVHGYGGKVRRALVTYRDDGQAPAARKLARLLHGEAVHEGSVMLGPGPSPNVLALTPGSATTFAPLTQGGSAGGAVTFVFTGDAASLARDPGQFRYRFSVP
jgi:hypothetical protein